MGAKLGALEGAVDSVGDEDGARDGDLETVGLEVGAVCMGIFGFDVVSVYKSIERRTT